ncbi:MAG: hypothetical protein HC831_22480 [Chloroflexia bacterium]|nr:hypothetical protein [Chloroflexia bacterium]
MENNNDRQNELKETAKVLAANTLFSWQKDEYLFQIFANMSAREIKQFIVELREEYIWCQVATAAGIKY